MIIPDKAEIKLNQNLCFVVGCVALGSSLHWGLHQLFWPAYLFTWGTGILVFVSCAFYSAHYVMKKWIDACSLWKGGK